MFKNMDYEYEFNAKKNIEDNEYDSEYEEYSDPEYVEATNDELEYMAENYQGKYVGEKRRSIQKCVKTDDKQNLKDEKNEYVNVGKYSIEKKVYFLKKKPVHKLFSNKITIIKIISVRNEENKVDKNEENKVDKNEENKVDKHKNFWNKDKEDKDNENKDNKNISLIDFPVIGTSNKDFKVLMNNLNDEKWIEIKEKTRKQKSSPTLSIKSSSSSSSKSYTVFTKLCSFIIKNEECPNKDNCTFAHKTDDLILKKCMFDDDNNSCRNVKYINGQYININKNMVCIYNHSRETRSNYLKRVYNIKSSLDVENKPVKKQIKIENLNKNENEEIAQLLTWCKKNEVSIPEAKRNEKEEDEWIKIEKEKNNRTKAFEILSDKEKIKTQLKFTKMCFSFINKTTCPHKENCRFAHDIKDLIIRDCLFQDKCFNVKKDGQSTYINTSKTKICDCIHKDETNDNYYNRIGIKTKIDLVKQKSSPVQIIKKININPWNIQKVPIIEINKEKEKSILKVQENSWNIQKVPIIEINKEKSILKVQENAWNKKPSIREDIHIKVPKHLEEIVIKMALKNNKSVKVETY